MATGVPWCKHLSGLNFEHDLSKAAFSLKKTTTLHDQGQDIIHSLQVFLLEHIITCVGSFFLQWRDVKACHKLVMIMSFDKVRGFRN